MCGGAAGVIDCEQIGLVNFRTRKFSRARLDHCFVVEPGRIRLRTADATTQGDEVFNARKAGSNAVDGGKILVVHTDHARTTMVDEINEVVRGQAIIQRHKHSADLRHRIKRFELRVSVR